MTWKILNGSNSYETTAKFMTSQAKVPSSEPLIRYARRSDAKLLADLGARTFSETFAGDNRPEDMAAYLRASFNPDQQASELADPLSTFLIAEIDRVTVGYAMLRAGDTPSAVEGEKPIELVRFYVTREWYGLGVAQTLMQACLEAAYRRNFRTLWLGVWEKNERARAFYRKWKFKEIGEHAFQLGADTQIDILMERPL